MPATALIVVARQGAVKHQGGRRPRADLLKRSNPGDLVDLRREDEVVAGEAGGDVRPGRERGPSPFELDARVVPFGLGQQRDPRDETERAPEIIESELPGQAAVAISHPVRDVGCKPVGLGLRQRGCPRRVLVSVIVEKLGDRRTVLLLCGVRCSFDPAQRDRELGAERARIEGDAGLSIGGQRDPEVGQQ